MLQTSRNALFLYLKPSPILSLRRCSFSSFTATPYPLYYELIHHRPVKPPQSQTNRNEPSPSPEADPDMDRSKRKYYRKRAQRMLPDPDADSTRAGSQSDDMVELKPEIVDFPRLHAREEELYFHDAFAFPWEKDKHYRMVYQLEKKYFPEQSLDKAFVDPDAELPQPRKGEGDERGLVFFEEGVKAGEEKKTKKGVEERNVKEFFKCLKKVPNDEGKGGKDGKVGRRDLNVEKENIGGQEPFLVSRRTELPPRWDGPTGTVVLVDKPKG